MRHTFQITVDYEPDARNLATLRDSILQREGENYSQSEAQTRKAFAKRLVLAVIDQHPELSAITRPLTPPLHTHTHTHKPGDTVTRPGATHTHTHTDMFPYPHAHISQR